MTARSRRAEQTWWWVLNGSGFVVTLAVLVVASLWIPANSVAVVGWGSAFGIQWQTRRGKAEPLLSTVVSVVLSTLSYSGLGLLLGALWPMDHAAHRGLSLLIGVGVVGVAALDGLALLVLGRRRRRAAAREEAQHREIADDRAASN